MKHFILLLCCLMTLLLAACGGGQTIVLMPDLDGHVGQVQVDSKTGETVTLNQANQAVTGKDKVTTLSDEQVKADFSEALAAQPEPTARFVLQFLSDSADLRPESEALIPAIMESYRTRLSRDVSIIGHTSDIIEMTSHGEENPLVPTPDGKAEPRNRRVEVLVR